ncbi:MAG TPA: hypothetical protein VHE55_04305 [Fimbriimonadaceae bacterium]|nr:hypothetical protein [Fimbriimonadaceae bacterium]
MRLATGFWCSGICLAIWMLIGCGEGKSDDPVATASPMEASQSSPPDASKFGRPLLERQSGQYFKWLAPAGWTATESPNGVDLSSPDRSLTASAALLKGSRGQTDPWTFTNMVLAQAGMRDIRQISSQNLPSQPSGMPGFPWTIQEFEITYTDGSGQARHADYTCGICGVYGRSYDALIQGFSTPAGSFDKDKTWLPVVAGSVNAIDASKVAYQRDLIPVSNHPLDDSAIMESWETRRRSQDHIDQTQRETTMGYERMTSPIDGKTYDMPFELYDETAGGYRDPADRNQILKHAPPGQ